MPRFQFSLARLLVAMALTTCGFATLKASPIVIVLFLLPLVCAGIGVLLFGWRDGVNGFIVPFGVTILVLTAAMAVAVVFAWRLSNGG